MDQINLYLPIQLFLLKVILIKVIIVVITLLKYQLEVMVIVVFMVFMVVRVVAIIQFKVQAWLVKQHLIQHMLVFLVMQSIN